MPRCGEVVFSVRSSPDTIPTGIDKFYFKPGRPPKELDDELIGAGTHYPFSIDTNEHFLLGLRYFQLRAAWDLVITTETDDEPDLESVVGQLTVGNAFNDQENVFSPTYFSGVSSEPDAACEYGEIEIRPFLWDSGTLYPFFLFYLNDPTTRLITTEHIPPSDEVDVIFTYPSTVVGMVNGTPLQLYTRFGPLSASQVSGYFNLTVSPLNGFRPYSDGTDPIYDKDTGEQLITPLPSNIVL